VGKIDAYKITHKFIQKGLDKTVKMCGASRLCFEGNVLLKQR